jgi:hypothetical protein
MTEAQLRLDHRVPLHDLAAICLLSFASPTRAAEQLVEQWTRARRARHAPP